MDVLKVLMGKLGGRQREKVHAVASWGGLVAFALMLLTYSAWTENRGDSAAMVLTGAFCCALFGCLFVYGQTMEEDVTKLKTQFREAIEARDLSALAWFLKRMRRGGVTPEEMAAEAHEVAGTDRAAWDALVKAVDTHESHDE